MCSSQSLPSFIDHVLGRIVQNQIRTFGENSDYVCFERDKSGAFDSSAGFNSSALFGRIVYRKSNETVEYKSKSLIIKLIPPKALHSESLILQFFHELFFFSRVLPYFRSFRPSIDDLFAEFIGGMAHYNADIGETALVFENLQNDGYKSIANDAVYLDYAHAKLVMRKLGQFHGYSFVAKAKEPRQFHYICKFMLPPNFANAVKHDWTKFAQRGVRALQRDAKYCDKLDKVFELINSVSKIIDETLMPNSNDSLAVLCHGDFLQSNMLFKYKGESVADLKILDPAMCVLTLPGLDLAYVLYLQTDGHMRNKHWDDLIDEYYRSLREICQPDVEPPDKDAIVNTLKLTWFYVYLTATYFLPHKFACYRHEKSFFEVMPSSWCEGATDDYELPEEVWTLVANVGGEEATEAVADILRDVIDRGFA